MKKDPTEFRKRFTKWKAGEQVYNAGRIVEKSDNTSVQRQEPVQPIKRNFIAEAQRKHAAEAVGPDTRSSYQRKQSQAAKQYANQQYQKAKDDAKRAEGLEQMMKTVSPSTYVEAATGQNLGTAGRLITDAVAFGLPGAIKSIAGPTMQYGRNFLLSQTMRRGLNKNPILRTYNSSPQYLDTGGNVLDYQDYVKSIFPNSKVKDIVYHSTWAKPFEQFDPGKIKRGYGFYFSPSENHLPFDRMVYSKVDIRNPLEIFPNKNRNLDVSGLWRKELTEKAIKEGQHDGVIGVSNMRNPGEPEIVALNPNQVHILGSRQDRNQFAGFVHKLNRKSKIKDGYIYKNGTIMPSEYKYYGQKVNYSNPSINELSDYQLDDMIGDYIGRGAERTVYQDLRNSNRVLKITDGGSPDVQITNKNDLLDYIEESLRINNLPEVPRLSYEGFIKDENRYLPVFSQQKVIPLKKVADPFQIFTRQYVLPNGKTPSGKLSAIRKMNPDAFSRIGYKPIPTKPGVYSVNGIGGPYNVTDLGQKNVGIDALGNIKIFDPMFE